MLVSALRNGDWVVLDELNLAPSDVLEALNRLLDDNRELYIPEIDEVIKPHPNFMLFATQNPAGQYGGRKQLSRAFRNRFLELHFTDIPQNELEIIIERKSLVPPSYAKKIVKVYEELSKHRDSMRIFEKHVVTLRDLFRWADRKAESYMELAQDGYILLSERARSKIEQDYIQKIIESNLNVELNMEKYYSEKFDSLLSTELQAVSGLIWTATMKRLLVLVYLCIQFQEPVLLVGETGCGKTSVCQVIAQLLNSKLSIVNAHQNSESQDFLGSQRPVRNNRRQEIEELYGGITILT